MSQLSMAWLRIANEAPPLQACTGGGHPAAVAALDATRAVLACFPPLPSTCSGAASIEEMTELLRLLRRQLAGERSAHAARIAAGRIVEQTEVTPCTVIAATDEAQGLVAQLACSALTYASSLLGIEVSTCQ